MNHRHALFGIALVSLAVRLGLVLSHTNYLGVDGGAYLLSVNAVLGDEPTGAAFPRPPLAPGWLMVPFTLGFGPDLGYKIWQALASIPPIFATYLLSRKFLTPNQSLVAAALIAVDLQLMEMLVTGALPLVGFSLIVLGVWAIAESTHPNINHIKYPALIIVVLPLIAFTNQTAAGIAAVVFVVYTIAIGSFHPCSNVPAWIRLAVMPVTIIPILSAAVIGVILSLTALPWYLDVVPGNGVLRYPGPLLYLASWGDTAWLQFAWGVPVGAYLVWKAEDFRLRAVGLVVTILSVLVIFFSYDESIINIFYRSRYLVMMFWIPAAVWIVARHTETVPETVKAAVAFGIIGVLGIGSIWTFFNQARYSDQITRETAVALDALRTVDPDSGIVVNTFSMAHWVSALNKVPSPHAWTTKPPDKWRYDEIRVRCLLGWIPRCDWQEAADVLGVRWVLVDERFPSYNSRAPSNYGAPENQWQVTADSEWLELIYESGTTKLWHIEG